LKQKFLQILLLPILGICIFVGPYFSFLNNKIYIEPMTFDIKKGSTSSQILNNISKDPNPIEIIFIKLFLTLNSGNYQSGEYEVSNKSLIDIHNQIIDGNTVTHQITVVPGMNKYDIDNLINNSFLINDCQYLNCIQSDYNFTEGMILPDTYYYKKGMKSSLLLKRSSS